jgi:hypothetical protein
LHRRSLATADFVEHGIERTGLTGIEHKAPRSREVGLINDYSNCFYACRFCNDARSDAPTSDQNARHLLDPCSTGWASRFRLDGQSLVPCDGDAEYTAETYDLNDPRKIVMRRSRAQAIGAARRVLAEMPARIRRLLQLVDRLSEAEQTVILDAAEHLQLQIVAARQELSRFVAVPHDADEECRCGSSIVLELPAFLAPQCAEL